MRFITIIIALLWVNAHSLNPPIDGPSPVSPSGDSNRTPNLLIDEADAMDWSSLYPGKDARYKSDYFGKGTNSSIPTIICGFLCSDPTTKEGLDQSRAHPGVEFKHKPNDSPVTVTIQQDSGLTNPQPQLPASNSTVQISAPKKDQEIAIAEEKAFAGAPTSSWSSSRPAYTIHLESWHKLRTALSRVKYFKTLGLVAFSQRVDLGEKGVYFRVYVGLFVDRKQAEEFKVQLARKYDLGRGLIKSFSLECSKRNSHT